jgi:plastocyanin
MRRITIVGAASLALLLFSATATGDEPTGQPTNVNAEGNAFTGGLAFVPASVKLTVGRTIQWTNTDVLVPHTATEDHGLWDLGGSYGATPANPSGFGPGEKVSRIVEAGTAHYYCRVHPVQMHGVIEVPVDLRMIGHRGRFHGRVRVIRYISATWAGPPPADGEGFDVQIKRGAGDWQAFRDATRQTGALLRAGVKGTVTHVRARLRKLSDPKAAEDWSPDASIVSDQKPLKAPARRRPATPGR